MTLAQESPQSAIDDRIHPPFKLVALRDAAAQEGIDAGALLAGTGLAPAALDDAGTVTSVRQFLTACRNAITLDASTELPFRAGAQMRVARYGLYGLALLTRPTAREAAHFAIRFHRLAMPLFRLSLHEDPREARWVLGDLLGLTPADPLHRFLVEFQLSTHVALAQDLWPQGVRPTLATMRHPAGGRTEAAERWLGCPVRFAAPQDSLRFEAQLLDAPLSLHHPPTASVLQSVCERMVARSPWSSVFARRVYTLLAEQPGRFDGMDEVAAALSTTTRTLRRRLDEEGTSFQRILDAVRADLAKAYLTETRLTTDDVANVLGFSDAANFRQAFRKWTQRTPSDFRRQAPPEPRAPLHG